MSTIKTNPAIPGAIATAAGVNATYAAIQTGTAALSDINEQTEWATFSHLNGVTNDTLFTTDMQTFCNPDDTYTLTSETYVVINLGGVDPVRVSYAPALTYTSGNELLRVHADINLDAVSEEFALPAVLMNDQDCFFLQLWYRDGTNTYYAVDCEWAYSVTNYTNFDATAIAFDTQPCTCARAMRARLVTRIRTYFTKSSSSSNTAATKLRKGEVQVAVHSRTCTRWL